MALRVKLRIRSRFSGREVDSVALVNSGFETLKPQLLIPMSVAEELGLWPSLPKSYVVKEYMTAGGPVKQYVVPDELLVKIVVEYDTPRVTSDAVISTIEEEVLISDKLTSALGIIIYDVGEGIWRLRTDPEDTRRRTLPRT